MKLNITKEEYIKLRNQGVPKEEILKLNTASQGQGVDNFLKTASKITDTFFGGGKVGEAIGTQIAKATVPKEQREFVAKGPSTGEIAGSALKSAALFAPVGKIAGGLSTGAKAIGIARGAGTLGKIGAGALVGETFDIAENLQTGEAPLKPGIGVAIGAGIPIAGVVIRGTSALSGKVLKNIAAGISGKGTKVVDAILENPQAALQGLRGEVTIAGNASNVRKAVSAIATKASKEFGDDLANLPKRLGRTPSILTAGQKTTIKAGGKTYILSIQGVKSKLTTELRKFDVMVNPKKKVFDFLESPLDRAEETRLREVFSTINKWKDTSPAGLYRLSRKISTFRKPGQQSPELDSIIDSVTKNTREYIGTRVPAAKTMLSKFSKAQDVIDVFDQEFATKGKFIGGTAARIKTERKLGTLFTGEKTTAIDILKEKIPGGKDVFGAEAGRLLGEGMSRSTSSIGDMLRTVVQTVITPRIIGEVVARTGMAESKVRFMLAALQKLDEPTRAATLNILSEIFREE